MVEQFVVEATPRRLSVAEQVMFTVSATV